MNIGVIGLGRMGMSIADRLVKAGHHVFGFDPNAGVASDAEKVGVTFIKDFDDLPEHVNIFWLMVPAGDTVDKVINDLEQHLKPGDIVIDGGNSFFKNTIKRHKRLAEQQVSFLDCGTSGGLKGREIGFSLMIGGDVDAFEKVKPLFEAIAALNGFALLGPAGAGHYVKTIHNGVEYALLQSYAEGCHLIKEGVYKDIDLAKVTQVWSNGSVIRSWITELLHDIFISDQDLKNISGFIDENKTGRWTSDIAKEVGVPVKTIEDALAVRAWSRETGGNYGTKVVAMLRNAFGGHAVKKK